MAKYRLYIEHGKGNPTYEEYDTDDNYPPGVWEKLGDIEKEDHLSAMAREFLNETVDYGYIPLEVGEQIK